MEIIDLVTESYAEMRNVLMTEMTETIDKMKVASKTEVIEEMMSALKGKTEDSLIEVVLTEAGNVAETEITDVAVVDQEVQ